MAENAANAEVKPVETIDGSKMDPKFREEVIEKLKNLDWTQCLACGMCTAGCVYSDMHPDQDPRKFLRKLVLGLREEALNDPFVWNCTVCERCTVECPMGVNFGVITRGIRGEFRLPTPGFLDKVANDHIRTGNQMAVEPIDWTETIEWIEEELQAELGDPNYKIPVGVPGREFLYGINARDVRFYPQELQEAMKLFYYAKADFTLGDKRWDATNIALFTGRNDDFCEISRPLFEECVRLGIKELVVTECGHAFKSCRMFAQKFWDGPEIKVTHVLEKIAEWITEGRIVVDKTKNPDPITMHDPCNTVRKEGVVEPQRVVMNAICADFREMYPNKRYNYCCGGGGGGMAMPEKKYEKMQKALRKIAQVDATGCQMVAVPCHNCIDQFADMNKEYKKGWKLTHIIPLVNKALVLPEKEEAKAE